jgi:hypothetical protein
MGVSGQLHTPTSLPPGKEHQVPVIGGWVGPSAGLDAVAKKKILLCQESNPGRPVHSLLWAVTANSKSQLTEFFMSGIWCGGQLICGL